MELSTIAAIFLGACIITVIECVLVDIVIKAKATTPMELLMANQAEVENWFIIGSICVWVAIGIVIWS